MVDFDHYLTRKYDILQQSADAEITRANAYGLSAGASAGLDKIRAGLLPGQAASEIAYQGAQTAGLLESNKTIAPLARSQIGVQGAQGGLYKSEAETNNTFNIGRDRYLKFLDAIRRGERPALGSLGSGL
jgi:hypothetical protein